MKNYKKNTFWLIIIVQFLLSSCTDPVVPEFSFKEGLIYIDAYISTSQGTSYVGVYESNTDFRLFRNIFQEGAQILFRNVNTNETITLIEYENAYAPPSNFIANIGETWEVEITLIDGRKYKSEPETISTPIEFNEPKAQYFKELEFNDNIDDFIPGHSISISFDDPAEIGNYYLWRFRSFERPQFCKICYDGLYRNGNCLQDPSLSNTYFTYTCETPDCFQIRYNENITIFSDEFVNGLTVNNIAVAKVPLYTKANILVEVEQLSISPSAYRYYKTIKDIVDNNSGFNAPPPSALIGNLVSLNSDDEYVLGRFTAAASSTKSVFIKRNTIVDNSIEYPTISSFEQGPGAITTAPCAESRYITGVVPEGWED